MQGPNLDTKVEIKWVDSEKIEELIGGQKPGILKWVVGGRYWGKTREGFWEGGRGGLDGVKNLEGLIKGYWA